MYCSFGYECYWFSKRAQKTDDDENERIKQKGDDFVGLFTYLVI